jgi:hypothetical protein
MGGMGLMAATGFLTGTGLMGGRTVERDFGMSSTMRLPSEMLKRGTQKWRLHLADKFRLSC